MSKFYHKYGPLIESFFIMVFVVLLYASFDYEVKVEQLSIAFATYLYLSIYRKTFEGNNDED